MILPKRSLLNEYYTITDLLNAFFPHAIPPQPAVLRFSSLYQGALYTECELSGPKDTQLAPNLPLLAL